MFKFWTRAGRAAIGLSLAALAACGGSSSSAPVTADWLTNPIEARNKALQEGRPLFVAFLGSGWSQASDAARKELLDTQKFSDFASDNLVLVLVDSTRTPQSPEVVAQNADLAGQAHLDRYPTFLLVDPRGSAIGGRLEYAGNGPENFIAMLQSVIGQWKLQLQQQASQASAPQPAAAPQLPQLPTELQLPPTAAPPSPLSLPTLK